MNNYYRIEVKALQNGYLVEAYSKVVSKDSYDGWRSKDNEFVFLTWDEVVMFMKNNTLEVPPKEV